MNFLTTITIKLTAIAGASLLIYLGELAGLTGFTLFVIPGAVYMLGLLPMAFMLNKPTDPGYKERPSPVISLLNESPLAREARTKAEKMILTAKRARIMSGIKG